jgi:hypothetical protein
VTTNGPTAHLGRPDQTAALSQLLGLAAVDAEGRHTADCAGCHGTADSGTCPYSTKQRAATRNHNPTTTP